MPWACLCADTTTSMCKEVILPFSQRVAKAIADPTRPILQKCTVIDPSPTALQHPNIAAPGAASLSQTQPQQVVRQAGIIPIPDSLAQDERHMVFEQLCNRIGSNA